MNKELVLNALKKVVDPEIGIDVVNLGLVYDVKFEGEKILVSMTLTSPGCPLAATIQRDAIKAVQDATGFTHVEVDIVWEPAWTPEKMSEEAKAALGM
ncbi:metal-sulfur cluster assembly factor [Candidatus Micrarchaeota archaeon]|nr:metal-sulfur cluster assembly factor [Candidatus Micrarchaeota archaeon]